MELIWSYLNLEKNDYLPFKNFAGVMVSDREDEAKEIFSLLDQEKRGKYSLDIFSNLSLLLNLDD